MLDFDQVRRLLGRLNPELLLGPRFEVAGYDLRIGIHLLIFLGALVAFEGLRQLLSRGENREEAVNRRIRMLAKGKTSEDLLSLLNPPKTKPFLGSLPFVGDLGLALRRAGVMIPPQIVLTGFAVAWFVASVAGAQVSDPLIVVMVTTVTFIFAPLIVLGRITKGYNAKFVKQLPDALDLMARGLKVGHPVNTSLQSVASEMPDPIGTEFGLVVDQIAYGEEPTSAIRDLAERIEEEDVQYLSIAIALQHGTGGDLAHVLRTLARVIRARMSLRRKIKAISSEGRLTAYILSALPVVIAVVMTVTSPGYYGGVMDYPSFWPIMSVITMAVVLNAIILLRLVNFRV